VVIRSVVMRESARLTPSEQEAFQALNHAAVPWMNFSASRLNGLVEQGKLRIFLAEQSGRVVGMATLGGLHLPRRLLRVCVHPRHQRLGVGSALLEPMLALVPDGIEVCGAVSIGHFAGMRFARRHGFVVSTDEDATDHLDLALLPTHPRPAAIPDPRVRALGSWLESYGETALHAVMDASVLDLPSDEHLGRWRESDGFLDSLDPQLSAVAFNGQTLVGFTFVRRESNVVHILNTVVIPAARRQGLGRALKTHTVASPALGAAEWLTTESVRGNAPIMALNRSLGFVDVSTRFSVRAP